MRLSFAIAPFTFFLIGCGGTTMETPSGMPDGSLVDASSEPPGSEPDGAPSHDASSPPMSLDAAPLDARKDAITADVPWDGPLGCECRNLDDCCRQAAQGDYGVACRADVARGDEAACRAAVLQGKYGCLALGFVPHCSSFDDELCPKTTTRCTQCLTSIRSCGPVIQCVDYPKCKAIWDSVVACDQSGRDFFECFRLLEAGGVVPGELVLLGAQCVETCRSDR